MEAGDGLADLVGGESGLAAEVELVPEEAAGECQGGADALGGVGRGEVSDCASGVEVTAADAAGGGLKDEAAGNGGGRAFFAEDERLAVDGNDRFGGEELGGGRLAAVGKVVEEGEGDADVGGAEVEAVAVSMVEGDGGLRGRRGAGR